jgi:hypothetical protein
MSGRTCCESCFGCISAYLTYLCLDTYYDKVLLLLSINNSIFNFIFIFLFIIKCLKKISAFIDEQNDTVWKPRGLYVTDPIERGLRVIEIVITDSAEHSNVDNSIVNNRNAWLYEYISHFIVYKFYLKSKHLFYPQKSVFINFDINCNKL